MVASGCNKGWRLSHLKPNELDELILQDSVEGHSNHDKYARNGGRGIDIEQWSYY
jgi:hypothetical protein